MFLFEMVFVLLLVNLNAMNPELQVWSQPWGEGGRCFPPPSCNVLVFEVTRPKILFSLHSISSVQELLYRSSIFKDDCKPLGDNYRIAISSAYIKK